MNKKVLIVVAIALAVVLIVGGVLIFAPSQNFTVAFYRIDGKQRQGITDVINKIAEEHKFSVVFNQYDSEKSLDSQLLLSKKPNLILTTGGFAVSSAVGSASKKAALSSDISGGMTSSMRSAIKQKDDKIFAVPFLSSHFEVDIDTQEFRDSSVKNINTWNDMEKFMLDQKKRKDSPFIFAGGEHDTFLDMIGAFAESLDGLSSYTQAAKILKENEKDFNAVKVAALLCDEPDSPLATTIKTLKNWYLRGLIHQGVFSFKSTDVDAFADSRLASILIMSLEDHRATSQKSISRFTSIYFPSEHGANSRVFTGKTYYAVPVKKSSKNQILLSALLSQTYQENLSRATGLAPVLAQCRTPDKQADDARYWIAATTAPLAGLSSEVYLTAEQKKTLAAEIISRIRY